ncbi:MAG: zinc-ribbon domain-containing protein [Oscillospiraceae bacterium]|nr:zinc-ribbon domain-containing protein [Oscillospiraceae bacterium]
MTTMIKCPECGKKISGKAKICPKCGMDLVDIQISDETSIDNATVIKSKKIPIIFKVLLILILFAAIIAAGFTVWLFKSSQYVLDNEKVGNVIVLEDWEDSFNKAYSKLDRQCRISEIFGIPLSRELSDEETEAMIYLSAWMEARKDISGSYILDWSDSDIESAVQWTVLAQPFHYHGDEEKSIEDIQSALNNVKEQFCK